MRGSIVIEGRVESEYAGNKISGDLEKVIRTGLKAMNAGVPDSAEMTLERVPGEGQIIVRVEYNLD